MLMLVIDVVLLRRRSLVRDAAEKAKDAVVPSPPRSTSPPPVVPDGAVVAEPVTGTPSSPVGTGRRACRAVTLVAMLLAVTLGVALPWWVPAIPAAFTTAYDAVVPPPTAALPPSAAPEPPLAEIARDAHDAGTVGVLAPRPAPLYLPGELASSGRPLRVQVPRLGVDAPVVPISGQSGTLTPPDDPSVLGWWREGRSAGAGAGTAVVTGHTVHTGGGALDELGTLRPGDIFTVGTGGGRITYRVLWQHDYPTAQLARQAPRLFGQDDFHRLLLITCSGWNGRGYDFSAVVYARPVAEVPRTPHGAPPVGGAPAGVPASAGAGGGVVDRDREDVSVLRGDRRRHS